jgi:GAF domain-containing protein
VSSRGGFADGPSSRLLAAVAARSAAASRIELGSADALLRSIVEAASSLFDSEAASIALHDPATGRLRFVVAAGAQGASVVGLEIPADRGLVGYVFQTGQALAIADVAADKRFGKGFAEATGYVPRSIVAVPLLDAHGTIGVLEVLDKRSEGAFSLRDVELAGVFAHQAAVAIRASRVERDTAQLLRTLAERLSGGELEPETLDAAVGAATTGLDEGDDLLWALADRIAAIRGAAPEQLELVVGLLDVLVRRAERDRVRRAGSRRPQTGDGR